MAAHHPTEPTTFGAIIEKPAPTLHSKPSQDSTMSNGTKPAKWSADPSNPYSAFYKHPTARRSLDADAPDQPHLQVTTSERDVVAANPLSPASTQQLAKTSFDQRLKECTMWPSRQAVMDKRKIAKRHRGCSVFHNLTRQQRLWVQIIIALLVIAAAVGLGVGISRAVGGGVWAGQGKNRKIPPS